MSSQQTLIGTHSVETLSGRISYAAAGSGPVALFVHGVVLNKHLWRHQLIGLSDICRCIAVDLLAHGDTEIAPDQDVSVTANAKMLKEMLDVLKIDQVDLIGNDSGGGIAQIFAALNPGRVRTLTLTNCDTHDNWPPEAFKPFVDMVKAGGLRDTLNAMLADKTIFRSPGALGPAYEQPETVTDEDIETYLRKLQAPTLIIWGTDDVYFPVKWAHWLAETIPGAKPPVELTGARIFFPEERADEFNQLLRDHLLAQQGDAVPCT
jgi:pimeloyl-ACP methyl ester carboxylesterase